MIEIRKKKSVKRQLHTELGAQCFRFVIPDFFSVNQTVCVSAGDLTISKCHAATAPRRQSPHNDIHCDI